MTLSRQETRNSMLVCLIRAYSLPETCNRWITKSMVKFSAPDTDSRYCTKWYSYFLPTTLFFWKYFSPLLFSKILTHWLLISTNTHHHPRGVPLKHRKSTIFERWFSFLSESSSYRVGCCGLETAFSTLHLLSINRKHESPPMESINICRNQPYSPLVFQEFHD